MPYNIRHEGNKYQVIVTSTGKVVGTHPTKAQAQAQLGALYTNVPDVKKLAITGGDGWSIEFGTPDCQHGYAILKSGTGQSIGCYITRAEAEEALKGLDNNKIDILGDEVRTTKTPEEFKENNVAQINKCMTCGCDDLGNDHHYISDEEKCLYCVTKGQGPCWDGYEYVGTKEKNGKTVPDCVPVKKSAESGFKPNAGMKAAAHKALKWKEDGKATGAGTAVGWGRARQIVNGESLSLDTVKRMYSFFSRHEVDKKGKEWDKPSHGKVMWYAWGGDAGFAWSRAIVERQNKIEKGDSIWSGVFVPANKGQMGTEFNAQDQDARYYFPSKATYENDGQTSAGYGNRSSNDSTPKGTYTPDRTTRPSKE